LAAFTAGLSSSEDESLSESESAFFAGAADLAAGLTAAAFGAGLSSEESLSLSLSDEDSAFFAGAFAGTDFAAGAAAVFFAGTALT